MQRSNWQPLWEFLANCAIGITVLMVMLLIVWLIARAFADVDLSGAISFILLAVLITGGALISSFAGMHRGMKIFIDSIVIRIFQNFAIRHSEKTQKKASEGFLSFVVKAMSGLAIMAFISVILSLYLKFYSSGKDAVLTANIDSTLYFAVRGLLVCFPFLTIGLIYLGKIKPALPESVQEEIIGGQIESLDSEAVEVSITKPPEW